MTDTPFSGRYKLSDRIYLGFPFSKIFSHYLLDEPPRTLVNAAVSRVMLQPQPDALNLALPPIHQLSTPPAPFEVNEVGFGYKWLADCTAELRLKSTRRHKDLSLLTAGAFYSEQIFTSAAQFRYFPNFSDSADRSCATTLMNLLGVSYPITDKSDLLLTGEGTSTRPGDPYKLGLPYEQFMAYVYASVRPGIRALQVADFADPTSEVLDRQALTDDVSILICIHGYNHVSYFVREDVLLRELKLYQDYKFSSASTLKEELGLSLSQIVHELDVAYPPNTGRPGGKIHITLPDVIKNLELHNGQYALLKQMYLHRDKNNWEAVICTTLLLTPFLESHAGIDLTLTLLRIAPRLMTLEFTQAVKVFKELHNHIRQFSSFPNLGLASLSISGLREYSDLLYGLDTIAGRSELIKLDFSAELIMRSADPTRRAVPTFDKFNNLIFDITKYKEYEAQASIEVFDSILPDRISVESFSTWYNRRMFWAASGGAPGATVTWTTGSADDNASPGKSYSKEEKIRINKRGALLAIPERHFTTILMNAVDPVQWSVKALKYEPGKLRSILNTSMESYLFQGYLLDIFDNNVLPNTWYASANAGLSKVYSHVRRLKELKSKVGCMWDYADFNINHTFHGMQVLYQTLTAELLKRLDWKSSPSDTAVAAQDIKRISSWVLRARGNTYVQDNDTKNIMQLARSLQSGERGTSFTNTLRSGIDHGIVRRAAAAFLGRELTDSPGDKTGDDVFLTTLTMRDAILLCCMFNICGFAGQVHKVLVSYPYGGGARGEFIRYGYDAASGSVRGYPLRALSGFVHGEFFHEPIHSPAERGAAILEQFAKLTRRGLRLPTRIMQSYLQRATRMVYTDHGIKKHISVPLDLILTPAALGGVGVSFNASGLLTAQERTVNALTPGRFYFIIPSGEGKSTLAKRFPEYFCDHDDLVDHVYFPLLQMAATNTGNWEQVNAYLAGLEVPLGKILLTWSTATAPKDLECAGVILQRYPTGLRANKANRASVMKELKDGRIRKGLFHTVKDFSGLQATALHLLTKNLAFGGPVRIAFTDKEGNIKPLPRLHLPRLNAYHTLRKAKTKVVDYDTMAKFGVFDKVAELDEDLLASGLTSALPKSAISNAIAKQASELDIHLQSVSRKITRAPTLVNFNPGAELSIMETAIAKFIHGLPELPKLSPPSAYLSVVHPSHHYNSLPSLIRPLGFSNGKALSLAISGQKPPSHGKYEGNIAKLLFLLASAKRHLRTGDGGALSTIERYSNFVMKVLETVGSASESQQNVHAYLEGTLNLYPPQNMTVPAEIISLERDLALNAFESRYITNLKENPEYIRELLAALDEIAHLAVAKILQREFPNFNIRD